jgi:hypothetical protein
MNGFVFGKEWKVSGGKCKDRAEGYIYKYLTGIRKREWTKGIKY